MKLVLTILTLLLAMEGAVVAQVPRTISFQGVLADAQGNLLPDNTYTLTLSIYDAATGGNVLFSESQPVQVFRGVFNAIIGSTSPTGIPAGLDFNAQYWLGVQVNNGTELAPRTPFTSVPYALNAATAQIALRANQADTAAIALQADRATLADTAVDVRGGFVANINGQQGGIELLGAGATTITRTGNQFYIRSTDTSGGGIRRIDNFDGSLVVDPPQGPYVTVFIRAEGVQTYHLADMSITTGKIADMAVTNAKLAPNSVTTDKIVDGTIVTADIGPNQVTASRIGTEGAPAGTALMSNGSATPVWTDPILMNLPYSATVTSPDTLWSMNNTGTGGAGGFNVMNPASTATALTASSDGTGPALAATNSGTGNAGVFQQTNPASTATAVRVMNGGVGNGLEITIRGGSGLLFAPSAVVANAGGAGTALTGLAMDGDGVFAISRGAGVGVAAANWGTGEAARIGVTNSANVSSAADIYTHGTGHAGLFSVFNTASTASAVEARTEAVSRAASAIAGYRGTDTGFVGAGSKGSYSPVYGLHAGVFGASSDVGVQGDGRLGVLGICTQSSGTVTGLFGYARDFGNGARIEVDPVTPGTNTSSALFAGNYGAGRVLNLLLSSNTFGTTANASDVISATSYGTGRVANFAIANSADTAAVMEAATNGLGPAGMFKTTTTGWSGRPTVAVVRAGLSSGFADGAMYVNTAGSWGIQTVAPPGGTAVYGVITSTPLTSTVSWNPNSAVNGVNLTGSGNAIAGWASPGGRAGFFNGDVYVTGTLTAAGTLIKPGGSFRIDHPLDPENKYLYHSFVESPDMKNIYDGVVVLDGNGSATVELPAWFEALNRELRYQLTCIGGFAPVYVAEEVAGNRFVIAGGKAGMKVSWQLTGIRQDSWANANRIPVEQDKPAEARGRTSDAATGPSSSTTTRSDGGLRVQGIVPANATPLSDDPLEEARAHGIGPNGVGAADADSTGTAK